MGSIPLAYHCDHNEVKRSQNLQLRASPCDSLVVLPLYETLGDRNDSYSLIIR
ncbi:MAG: hypothetical protein V7L27_22035 [Nostoc sp.]|uniref:hypothetical protein n=1 Tax=Nostoc sp. TaxID=1180 RepID=UPI002FF54B3A